MKKVLLYLSILLSYFSYAFVAGRVEVSGVVVSYDKEFVTLQNGKARIEVPKKTVKLKPKTKLTRGTKVYALLTVKELNDTILRAKENNRRIASHRSKNRRIKSNRRIASERSRKRKNEPEREEPTSLEYDH